MFTYEIVVMDTTNQCSPGHLEARIICLDTGIVRVVNWDGFPKHQINPLTDNETKLKKFNTRLDDQQCDSPKPIILYSQSNRTMDEFSSHISQYMDANARNYCGDKNKFSKYFNNCSDAVNFTLDYFFPHNEQIEKKIQTFKFVTFPAYIATCGIFPCFFGVPPGMNSPKDVMKKAHLLSRKYAIKPNLVELTPPLPQRMVG